MHIHTTHEVCKIVERMMNDYNMGLGKAVNYCAGAYGYSEEQIYRYMTIHNIANQGHTNS